MIESDTRDWLEVPTDRGWQMISGATRASFWLDRPERPDPRPALVGDLDTDLLVIGAGFTGLWTAVIAAEENPGRRIVVVEADRIAEGASGRNGGFCSASLTHGLANGVARHRDELATLLTMGVQTLDEIEKSLVRLGVDADAERVGELDIANHDWQLDQLREHCDTAAQFGLPDVLLDTDAARATIASPMVLGATFDPHVMMLDPARLAWGLAAAAERLGVHIAEHTAVTGISRSRGRVRVSTAIGSITADRVVVATGAARPLRRRDRWATVPVWDYVLMTEPLSPQQRAAIGWSGREGLADCGSRFHYFRLTADDRILFGGWDALYRFGSDRDVRYQQDDREFALLAEHLVQMFPQLDGVGISHRWGGAIDTCTRFSAYWDLGLGGRVVSVLGFTGLGVGASHFAARTALDLVDGRDTERTRLSMVRRRPLPFPPEPMRWIGITITRREFARMDRNRGRRGWWLRTMDALGLGFDS
ncbi:FAD-binding oxidoreductase [Williamsia sp. CHRR-6]|uniref:NAD(P)/FAD-dependent oxidoreductase n=1 Tax=Williamsia sp. CHRR-6 TaxID=2835871 RepID=UPI001BDB100B|nr:FAD-dependent oxidoreductase [Williamsia sp. CHRR-6]MBT0566802.1 FAD-dependent oxidoreductase [Williamsia sp. CHRR-6]